jgi:hypothetical protein
MIAVITRTSNRPKYFNRCYNSVKNTNVVTSHHVLYDSVNDISYLSDKKVIPHFIDKNKFLSYNEPAPSTARPPMLSLHNLYFNEVYNKIKEPWVYHLDDDNYIIPNSFNKIVPYLTSDIDMVICTINHFTGTLPRFNDFKLKNIRVGGIDTGCFFVKRDLISKVKWDGWKCGDFRVIEKCSKLSKKIVWVDIPVMNMDKQNLGNRTDL